MQKHPRPTTPGGTGCDARVLPFFSIPHIFLPMQAASSLSSLLSTLHEARGHRCPLMSRTMRRGSEVKENEIPALKRQACQPNFGVFRLQKCYKLLVGPDTCPVQQTPVLILLREDAAGNNGKRLAGS